MDEYWFCAKHRVQHKIVEVYEDDERSFISLECGYTMILFKTEIKDRVCE